MFERRAEEKAVEENEIDGLKEEEYQEKKREREMDVHECSL